MKKGKRYKILEDFAINFIEKHFEELDLKRLDWNVSKEKAINEIRKKRFMAGWVIGEVMSWGGKKDYIKPFVVDNENEDFLIKIEDRYFLINYNDSHMFNEVFPKKILIEKLIYEQSK